MEPRTLDDVYRKYMPDVYRYLLFLCGNVHIAEDLMQETFYRAYVYLENYRDEKVKPWLFSVAYHAFIDMKRKENRSEARPADYFHALPDDLKREPESRLLQKEQLDQLIRWIAELPDLQKQALLLYDMHQFSYQEGADMLCITLSHFKILLFRARQRLKLERGKEGKE